MAYIAAPSADAPTFWRGKVLDFDTLRPRSRLPNHAIVQPSFNSELIQLQTPTRRD